jgi:hypothetical protein
MYWVWFVCVALSRKKFTHNPTRDFAEGAQELWAALNRRLMFEAGIALLKRKIFGVH